MSESVIIAETNKGSIAAVTAASFAAAATSSVSTAATTAATAAAAQSNGSHAFVTTTRGCLAKRTKCEIVEVKGSTTTSSDQTGAHSPRAWTGRPSSTTTILLSTTISTRILY